MLCSLTVKTKKWKRMELFKTCVQNKWGPKQLRNYVLVYSSLISIVHLILYYKNCVQNKRGLLFNLLNYFCSTKNVCSKLVRNCFLVYLATFVTEACVLKSSESCFLPYSVTFVIRKMYVQHKGEAAF